jgi:hypothetical protein
MIHTVFKFYQKKSPTITDSKLSPTLKIDHLADQAVICILVMYANNVSDLGQQQLQGEVRDWSSSSITFILALLIRTGVGNRGSEALMTHTETEIYAMYTERGRDTDFDKLNHATIAVC